MRLENVLTAGLDGLGGQLGAESQIKEYLQAPRDDISDPLAGANSRNLQRRWVEEIVTVIPGLFGEGIQCRHRMMNGIICKMGVGDVALSPIHNEPRIERAPATVFNEVAQNCGAGGFTHNAPVDLLPP